MKLSAIELPSWLQSIVPATLSISVLFVCSSLSPDIFSDAFFPNIGLISIYIWSLITPALMPLWLVFVFGVLQDILIGYPLGMSSCILLLACVVVKQKHHLINHREWIMMGIGFALVSLVSHMIYWVLMSLYHQHFLSIIDISISLLATWCIYPVLHMFYSAICYSLLSRQAKPIGVSR